MVKELAQRDIMEYINYELMNDIMILYLLIFFFQAEDGIRDTEL